MSGCYYNHLLALKQYYILQNMSVPRYQDNMTIQYCETDGKNQYKPLFFLH